MCNNLREKGVAMSTLAFPVHAPHPVSVHAACPDDDLRFCDEDVTTVYDALIQSDDGLLVQALLEIDAPSSGSARCLTSAFGASLHQRLSSMKRLALDVGPSFESAAMEAIVPWSTSCLFGLGRQSWPAVLGRRVVLPQGRGLLWWHKCLVIVLLSMAPLCACRINAMETRSTW